MTDLRTEPPHVSMRVVLGVMCSSVLALAVIETLPAFIGVLGTHFHQSPRQLGTLSAAELAFYIIGTYLTNAFSLARLAIWTPWACLGAAFVNLASVPMLGKFPLYLIYPLSALGGGICYGYMLKVIDATGNQRRGMGIYLALINVNVFCGFQLIAFATEKYSPYAVFIIYATCALTAGMLTLLTRRGLLKLCQRPALIVCTAGASGLSPRLAGCAVALALSYVAFGVLWPFVQLIGTSKSYSPFMIANALSTYSVTAILGSVCAAALPLAMDPIAILVCAVCVVLTSILLLCGHGGYYLFAIGCAMWGIYWPFTYAIQTAIVAKADRSGRAIVLCGLAPSVGMVVGSFVGGLSFRDGSFSSIAVIALTVCVTGAGGLIVLLPRPYREAAMLT